MLITDIPSVIQDEALRVEEELPAHVAARSQMPPLAALGTPWQTLFSDQLVDSLHSWFQGPSFSRRRRRAHARLHIPVRTADVSAVEGTLH